MKINENGRSMIEMLGVLAIIGVLSVGGIAGYSKAMTKYRENKTIDQVSHIAANTRILYSSQKDYGGLDSTSNSDVIDKAKLFNTEMGSGGSYQNPFAGAVTMKASGRFTSGDNKAFLLVYKGIPQEACIDLATIDWGTGSGGGLVALGVNKNVDGVTISQDAVYDSTEESTSTAGQIVTGGNAVMPVATAVAACDQSNTNILYFKFY